MARVLGLRKYIKVGVVFLSLVLVVMMVGDVIVNVAIPSMCYHEPQIMDKGPSGNVMDEGCVAHVKLEKKKRKNFSRERTVYEFEVIEWLNGGSGETRIQAYSVPYRDDCVKSETEYYEKHYGCTYEKGKAYIISLLRDDDNEYKIASYIYIPLYNLQSSDCLSKLTFRDGTVKAEELAPVDLVFYLREYYENKDNEENQENSDNVECGN